MMVVKNTICKKGLEDVDMHAKSLINNVWYWKTNISHQLYSIYYIGHKMWFSFFISDSTRKNGELYSWNVYFLDVFYAKL
jgi:hypothetical protein